MLKSKEQIVLQLEQFILKNKCTEKEWEDRGLLPSSNEITRQMNGLLNRCGDSLMELTKENKSKKDLKKALLVGLNSFHKQDFETEEREIIAQYVHELSEIVEVDLKGDLLTWMYGRLGRFLAFIFKIVNWFKSKKTVETISQACTKCTHLLETIILKRTKDAPDFSYDIVRCKSCGEYNMIDKGPGIKQFKFKNSELVEQLHKQHYTRERAELRLVQIQCFR